MLRKSNKPKTPTSSDNDVGLEVLVQTLADSMLEMQTSISKLAKTLEKSSTKPTSDDKLVEKKVSERIYDRQYIPMWRDLGGQNLSFHPGGISHPVIFLKKIEKLFEDAGVPEQAKVGLALNCLKGSAADWATNKEKIFSGYEIFKKAFKARYWGEEQERQLYYELKYGEYESGSRADYMLKMANRAAYLSDPINENDLVEMLIKHFPQDIRRGAVLSGIKLTDDLDEYLRKIDASFEGETNKNRTEKSSNNNNRDIQRPSNTFNREGQSNELNRKKMVVGVRQVSTGKFDI